jgi:hypothetical protein
MWNFKEELTDAQRKEYATKIKADLEGLVGSIDGLVSLKFEIDPLPSGNRDILLDSAFLDEESLKQVSRSSRSCQNRGDYPRNHQGPCQRGFYRIKNK